MRVYRTTDLTSANNLWTYTFVVIFDMMFARDLSYICVICISVEYEQAYTSYF